MSRPQNPCSICGRLDVLRKGMCSQHYQRWRVHGDPTVRLAPGRKPKPPSLVARCGDCGAVVGLVATPAGVWGALAAHRCEVAS